VTGSPTAVVAACPHFRSCGIKSSHLQPITPLKANHPRSYNAAKLSPALAWILKFCKNFYSRRIAQPLPDLKSPAESVSARLDMQAITQVWTRSAWIICKNMLAVLQYSTHHHHSLHTSVQGSIAPAAVTIQEGILTFFSSMPRSASIWLKIISWLHQHDEAEWNKKNPQICRCQAGSSPAL